MFYLFYFILFVLLREFPRFPSFRFWLLYWNRKLRKLGNIFSTLANSKECGLLEKVWNFRSFRVFDFGSYTIFENSKNSEIFSSIINFKGFVLFEEVGNFRGFRIFDFGLYAEIENSKNSEILCWVNLFYLRKLEISKSSKGFWFCKVTEINIILVL